MFKIVAKRQLNEAVTLMEIDAPYIAAKAKAGQFIIFRVDEYGERIPLTIADTDPEKGTVTIIFQAVGTSTRTLAQMNEGDAILDFVGPLGNATEIEGYKNVCVVGGGVGCAIAYPSAKALHKAGAHVDMIAGFRNKDIVILEEEMKSVATNVYVTTDDGSYGRSGMVTKCIEDLIAEGKHYDVCVAIGPMIMMKFCALTTKKYGIKTVVSMNPIMVDGTGMCGGCRLMVGGEVKFACVDGPEFDGHLVDFDQAMKRAQQYKTAEGRAYLKEQEGDTHHGGCGNCGGEK